MERFSENQKLFIGIAIGVLAGVVVTIFGFSIAERKQGDSPLAAQNITEETTSVREVTVAENDRVEVQDQPAGIMIPIINVTLASPSWVAIHETTNGMPTNILGAALFNEGVSYGTVELLRGTEPDRLYYARLYNDNGDRAFNPDTDSLIVDINKNSIQASFVTTE